MEVSKVPLWNWVQTINRQQLNQQLILFSQNRSYTQYWIGQNEIESPGTWQYFDATPGDSGVYVNWAPGQPNGDGTQNCIMMDITQDGMWEDKACTESHYITCKKTPGIIIKKNNKKKPATTSQTTVVFYTILKGTVHVWYLWKTSILIWCISIMHKITNLKGKKTQLVNGNARQKM